MSRSTMAMPRPRTAAVTAVLVLIGALAGFFAPGLARADSAPLDPTSPTTPTTASADPLPTVQINGVAWAQVVVGNTVYVAGKFTSARPAGVRAGTQETPRNNLLAYDVRTGALITSFAPSLNAQAVSWRSRRTARACTSAVTSRWPTGSPATASLRSARPRAS